MIVLGFIFRLVGLFGEDLAEKLNKFVFQVTLPLLLFSELATVDLSEAWDTKFVLFCFFMTIASIAIVTGLSFLLRDRSIQGEFIQASYRSSAAILGISFITNIYGHSGMAPMMIIGSVPVYNIMAVIILSVFHPKQRRLDGAHKKKTLMGIKTNPIILGILAGLLWSALKIPMPTFLDKTVTSIGNVSSPMGLMAMGASFDVKKALGRVPPSIAAVFIKLIGFCAVGLPLAIWLGFREEELIAILVMLGSATTVSGYVMARSMGHEGVLSSTVIMLTTLFSAFTMTFWLWLLRSLGFV